MLMLIGCMMQKSSVAANECGGCWHESEVCSLFLLDPLHCDMFSSTCRYNINFLATAHNGKFSAEIF